MDKENEKYKEALKNIEKRCDDYCRIHKIVIGNIKGGTIQNCLLIARAALKDNVHG